MSGRGRWVVAVVVVLLVLVVGAIVALPGLVRSVAIARLQAITKRPVSIERVDLHLLSGAFSVHALRVTERDGGGPFVGFERLDGRVRFLSLLRGHLWIRDLVLQKPTIRVVRLGNEFNFSDLMQGSASSGRSLDVTVDHFALQDGTMTFEDRALAEPRTWTSEQIRIEANNLSTRRDDGTAVGSSVTAGAPMSIEMQRLRLYPIHFAATVTAKGLDLGLARLYLPPDAPIILDQGRVSSTLKAEMDAKGGVRADVTGEFTDIVLVKPGERDPVARVPKLTVQLNDVAYENGRARLGLVEVKGAADVRDPRAAKGPRYQVSTVRASIADVTWPITTPGRVDVFTAIPGGGTLEVTGNVQPPPAPSNLRIRLSNTDLAPWDRFVPVVARITGLAEADLRINEPLAAGVPTRIDGSIAVNRLGVRDAQREVLSAQRIEASGLEVDWPTRVVAKQVLVQSPRGLLDRDRDGAFTVRELLTPRAAAPTVTPASDGGSRPATSGAAKQPATTGGAARPAATAGSPRLEVGEVVVRDGAIRWHDQTVKPTASLELSRIDIRITGASWPLRGPVGIRSALRPPGGGQVGAVGRVGLDPLTFDLRVTAKDAELAPYQPYTPTPARIAGRADFDLLVAMPAGSEFRATARGTAGLTRLDVRDNERTVMRVERLAATGVDVDWPQRVAVRQVSLERPWILLERDQEGRFPILTLAPGQKPAPKANTPQTSAASAPPPAAPANASTAEGGNATTLPITIGRLVVDDGGARVVDRAVSPPFAVDLARLALSMDGFSTGQGGKPARLDLDGRVGASSLLTLHGTIGPLGGPLRLDLDGELRGFAVPRTNPYLISQVAWEARDGWLTTKLHCKVDGNSLDAKTEILLSALEVAKAAGNDQAQARIGLPLGMVVSLMKDRRGDIHIALPIGGRLNDPRFQYSEVIWSTLRNVAVKAITAPVSWIGRVHVGSDSRIQRIDIDPIPFEPGTATLTPDGQEQVTRLVAFLDQMLAVRMAATPTISSRDLDEMKRPAVDAAIERVAREARISRDAAAARLYQERFPRQPVPESVEAIRAALAENEPGPQNAASGLAQKRVEVVKDMVKKAGIDPARLVESKAADVAQAARSEVKLDLLSSESPHRGRQASQAVKPTSDTAGSSVPAAAATR